MKDRGFRREALEHAPCTKTGRPGKVVRIRTGQALLQHSPRRFSLEPLIQLIISGTSAQFWDPIRALHSRGI